VFSGDLPEVFAAQVLFWVLLPIVIFASPRWGVLAWLIMGNLDASGPGQSNSTAVGWINATKGVVIPLYLWWRLRHTPSVHRVYQVPSRVGLSNALLQQISWRDAVIRMDDPPGLGVLPAGRSTCRASGLIGMGLAELIEEATREYDLVVAVIADIFEGAAMVFLLSWHYKGRTAS
jgi:hypothetical protein